MPRDQPRLDPDDPVVRAAVFGEQVRDFLEGDIGTYLVKRAEEERDAAIEKLKVISPWRRRTIQRLQNQIYVAESVQSWLADVIVSGQSALQALEEDE